MSNRENFTEARTISPLALHEWGKDVCFIALGVARDLRSGAIEGREYDQSYLGNGAPCGTPCCIAGWMIRRGVSYEALESSSTGNLFVAHPLVPWDCRPTPATAADAIERFVYGGSTRPWVA